MATATAALAAFVASCTLICPDETFALTLVWPGICSMFTAWVGLAVTPDNGITGMTRGLGPVGAALGPSVCAAVPFVRKPAATALTSSADGLDSTGRFGAFDA